MDAKIAVGKKTKKRAVEQEESLAQVTKRQKLEVEGAKPDHSPSDPDEESESGSSDDDSLYDDDDDDDADNSSNAATDEYGDDDGSIDDDDIRVTSLADVYKGELADDEVEVIRADGTIDIVKKDKPVGESEIMDKMKSDRRWDRSTFHGQERIGHVIIRAEKEVFRPQDIVDMSAAAKDEGATTKLVQCNNGDFVKLQEGKNKVKLIHEPLAPDHELVPCDCTVCSKQAVFQAGEGSEDHPTRDPQSGLFQSWKKYGKGLRLG
ncbi:uncharacterized protein K452DRAFT_299548 [Aplosporella prunicola CBS 121167]|uniref:Uncharacterized protein n=1 Tax=Aplosporella prunicola CBS 121167 TaxID=1176127 RepID=A0A6A6B9W2_9PEZI|nr:uncharacterized protein K452DRAFT_299548 [Aplosporella prunicola CBS 121167]KAF2140153.1 hypothetical protein K452DRAFT_299548 [Aplosporella prunicola CBS 121167]